MNWINTKKAVMLWKASPLFFLKRFGVFIETLKRFAYGFYSL
jgi:hypothetical protein